MIYYFCSTFFEVWLSVPIKSNDFISAFATFVCLNKSPKNPSSCSFVKLTVPLGSSCLLSIFSPRIAPWFNDFFVFVGGVGDWFDVVIVLGVNFGISLFEITSVNIVFLLFAYFLI